MLNNTFKALLKEAQFTKEMLGAGATQIRKANYASKGVYVQSFTSLSTGLERIGKLCLLLDYYIDNHGQFPNQEYLKKFNHNIETIYKNSVEIINKKSIQLDFPTDLNNDIHLNILKVLSKFAKGDRYSNLDILVNSTNSGDPIDSWFVFVDQLIFEKKISIKKKQKIEHRARAISNLTSPVSIVMYISETGSLINDVYEASYKTGMIESIAPYRQLYVLQIIRFWVDLLWKLQLEAMKLKKNDIPHMNEIFALFYNYDSYFRSRKTWEKI